MLSVIAKDNENLIIMADVIIWTIENMKKPLNYLKFNNFDLIARDTFFLDMVLWY